MKDLSQSKLRYNVGLEQIRGVACLLVFLCHVAFVKEVFFPPIVNYFLVACGDASVGVFLALSGFLFSLIYSAGEQKVSWGAFIKKRLWRIVPVYLFVFLIAQAGGSEAELSHNMHITNFNAVSILDWLFFTPIQAEGTVPTSAVWSVGVEFSIYLITPVLINVYLPLKARYLSGVVFLTAIGLLLVACYTPSAGEIYHATYYSIMGHLGQFIVGLLAGKWCVSNPKLSLKKALVFLVTGVLLLTSYCALWSTYALETEEWWRLIGVAGLIPISFAAVFVIIGFYYLKGISGPLGWGLEKYGKISYSFYLLHTPILRLFLSIFGLYNFFGPTVYGEISSIILFALAPSTLVAIISYFCIERPAINYIRNIK